MAALSVGLSSNRRIGVDVSAYSGSGAKAHLGAEDVGELALALVSCA